MDMASHRGMRARGCIAVEWWWVGDVAQYRLRSMASKSPRQRRHSHLHMQCDISRCVPVRLYRYTTPAELLSEM